MDRERRTDPVLIIKAIETIYNGHKFRSRLEARYAVFMDNLGIDWVYEYEGYKLPSGCYLPDFWLPTFNGGSFAEVKFAFNEHEIKLCEELCLGTKNDVIMFDGIPATKTYNYFSFHDGCVFQHEGCPNADQATREDRMYVEPGYQNTDRSISEGFHSCLGDKYLYSVWMANSARFEFNK